LQADGLAGHDGAGARGALAGAAQCSRRRRAGRVSARRQRRAARARRRPPRHPRGRAEKRKQKLAELRREFNNGEPERRGDERNYAKYQERVAALRDSISRSEKNVDALKRREYPMNLI
jgi:hypothetical protein